MIPSLHLPPLDTIRVLLEAEMRFQDPEIEIRGKKRRFYAIRTYIPTVNAKGVMIRARKLIRLGFVDSITRARAKSLKQEALMAVNAGPIILQSQIKFGDLVKRYKAGRLPELGASTQAKYSAHIQNHILPAFQDLKLYDIDRQTVSAWLAAKSHLAHATRLDLRNILSAIFAQAREWRLWDGDNPAQGVKLGRATAKRRKLIPTAAQLQLFLAAIPDTAIMRADRARLVALTAVVSGLRVSEVLGLQRGDVDAIAGAITVTRRWWRGDVSTPKSAAGERVVHVGGLAAEMLAGAAALWVFSRRNSAVPPDDRDLQQHVWRPAAEAVGIYQPGFGMHSLRRLNVSWRQEAGATPFEAMRAAGHASLGMTNLYTVTDAERAKAHGEAIMKRLVTDEQGGVQ